MSDRKTSSSRPTKSNTPTGRSPRKLGGRTGGFGPHGPPKDPERERRADTPRREKPEPDRPVLRKRGERSTTPKPKRAPATNQPPRRRKRRPAEEVTEQIIETAGRRGPYFLNELEAAADAYANDRDREAVRRLRPLRVAMPQIAAIRELLGLGQYRLGNYRAASAELKAFFELTESVEQHPVLMDCARAQRRWRRVGALWEELSANPTTPEIMYEGRIVAAGALGDQGRFDEAIALLERKAAPVRKPKIYHLRLWYALADLHERAGNFAAARILFRRVKRFDKFFVDVDTRLSMLH